MKYDIIRNSSSKLPKVQRACTLGTCGLKTNYLIKKLYKKEISEVICS